MTSKQKSFRKTNSTVISVKFPQLEYYIIEQYIRIMELSFTEFLFPIVNSFINLKDFQHLGDREVVQTLLNQKENLHIFDRTRVEKTDYDVPPKPLKEKISLRIEKMSLNEWDRYCEKHFLTRTGLVRAALHEFFYRESAEIIPTQMEFQRIIQLLEALFSGIGPIEEPRIFALFNQYDRSKIADGLNQLELEGKIGRKVTQNNRTSYVPTGLIEDSGDDPLIARILDRLI